MDPHNPGSESDGTAADPLGTWSGRSYNSMLGGEVGAAAMSSSRARFAAAHTGGAVQRTVHIEPPLRHWRSNLEANGRLLGGNTIERRPGDVSIAVGLPVEATTMRSAIR